MASPIKIIVKTWWSKFIESLPFIVPIVGVLGALLYTSGLYAIDERVDEKLTKHEKNNTSHEGLINLGTQQAVLISEVANIKSSIDKEGRRQEAIETKIDLALELLRSSEN